jgi:hypothetical protein
MIKDTISANKATDSINANAFVACETSSSLYDGFRAIDDKSVENKLPSAIPTPNNGMTAIAAAIFVKPATSIK